MFQHASTVQISETSCYTSNLQQLYMLPLLPPPPLLPLLLPPPLLLLPLPPPPPLLLLLPPPPLLLLHRAASLSWSMV